MPPIGDPLVGTRIRDYDVLEVVGEGGMGAVYRVRHVWLGQERALKLVRTELAGRSRFAERFLREGQVLASLDSPHLVRLYEFGQLGDDSFFMVMDLLRGRTVEQRIVTEGRLAPPEAMRLAREAASALSAAHAQGVVHRDVSPDNLFLVRDPDGRERTKVIDFGIAKPLGTDANELTHTVGFVGKFQYASPEQCGALDDGEEIDGRADVYSLGATLYSMLVGEAPFRASTAEQYMYKHCNALPEPPSRRLPAGGVSPELERVVLRALAKRREDRPASMAELAAELDAAAGTGVDTPHGAHDPLAATNVGQRLPTAAVPPAAARRRRPLGRVAATLALLGVLAWGGVWWASRAPAVSSLAVLPLANTGGDPEIDYLGDGIAEGVINRLALLPDLKVMARSTAFRFAGRQNEPVAVGRELEVDAVLTGRIVPQGDTARIEVEMVEVASGALLWGQRYVVRPEASSAVEEEIADGVTDRLRLRTEGMGPRSRTPVDPAAHTLYLKGRYQLNKRTPESLRQAQSFFEQAVERDPERATFHAGLADAWALIGAYSVLPPGESFPRALAAARRALALDESLADAHACLGLCTFLYEWDWAGAEAEFRRSTELHPGYATGHHWYAEYLMARGRTEESLAELERAKELDPLSLVISVDEGRALFFGRRFAEARARCRGALDVAPEFVPALDCLAMVATEEGRYDEAIRGYAEVSRLWGGNSGLPGRIMALARAGRRAEAEALVPALSAGKGSGYVPVLPRALVQAALGNTDEAFRLLGAARVERSDKIPYLKTDPRVDSLRADPRFAAFAQLVGL